MKIRANCPIFNSRTLMNTDSSSSSLVYTPHPPDNHSDTYYNAHQTNSENATQMPSYPTPIQYSPLHDKRIHYDQSCEYYRHTLVPLSYLLFYSCKWC